MGKRRRARGSYTLRRDLLKDCLVWIDRLVQLAAPQMKRCVKRLRRRRGPLKRGAVHNLIMSRYDSPNMRKAYINMQPRHVR